MCIRDRPKIEHKDKGAVTIGYGMHKLAVENRLQLDDICKLIYGETENRNTDFEIDVYKRQVPYLDGKLGCYRERKDKDSFSYR